MSSIKKIKINYRSCKNKGIIKQKEIFYYTARPLPKLLPESAAHKVCLGGQNVGQR